jgi:hypothetical protein
MLRVRKNVQLLVQRLDEMGYQLHNRGNALQSPAPDLASKIARLESQVGALPLSVYAFYEVVGGVDLMGTHPAWKGCDYPDPLVVFPVEAAIEELQVWEQSPTAYEQSFGSFRVPVSADRYHKENVSGGMWYGIALPNCAADAVLLEEGHERTFVEYLRASFQWGGFLGLTQASSTAGWPIEELRRGLLDI